MVEISVAGIDSVVDTALWVWFALTVLSVVYVAYAVLTSRTEMNVMKWSWVLVTLYAGPVGLILYGFPRRGPLPAEHEQSVAPLWKQSIESTIHCLAGCATGVTVAVMVASLLRLPSGLETILEYVASFVLGLFIFQALLAKKMMGCSYGQAVKLSCLPLGLSTNAVMAGMIPVMVILMSHDMQTMEPAWLRFWGILSLGLLVGAVLAYPVNWWLVKNGLQPGMSGMKREDRNPTIFAASKLAVTLVTLMMLAGGVALAARYGDLSITLVQDNFPEKRWRPNNTRGAINPHFHCELHL